jgi:hypothetical protein
MAILNHYVKSMYSRVVRRQPDVSEEHIAFILRINDKTGKKLLEAEGQPGLIF